MLKRTGLPFLLILLSVTNAMAVAIAVVETLECSVDEPVSIMVLPGGAGPDFTQARTITGEIVDATIRVQICGYDENGPMGPVYSFPAADLELYAADGQGNGCGIPSVAIADQATDVEGWTQFSVSPRAGGWSEAGIQVYSSGDPAGWQGEIYSPLPIRFNSPDITGDRVVDLSDIAVFTQDLYSGQAPYRSDFVWDGVINLSDITIFTQSLGDNCN